MKDWKPNLKFYPHFDRYLPEDEIVSIVTDKSAVAKNAFYPFLLFHENRISFGRDKSKNPRPIRYAARRDSYIYSYYRYLLSIPYEEKLKSYGLDTCIIAYRQIPTHLGSLSGKCNIHFAKEAFEEIQNRGECYAVALDIRSFFESIDHKRLEEIWCSLLGETELPPDHAAVYKAITKYADVDYEEVLRRLGLYGDVIVKGVKKQGYKVEKKKIPMQLCTPAEFRKKFVGIIRTIQR